MCKTFVHTQIMLRLYIDLRRKGVRAAGHEPPGEKWLEALLSLPPLVLGTVRWCAPRAPISQIARPHLPFRLVHDPGGGGC